jgi:hypothetical protein
MLLSSTAFVAPVAHADQSMEELEARLEKAKKRNLQLKAEMLERENITIEAEALEKDNARMEALKKTGKQAQEIQKSEVKENNKASSVHSAPHIQRRVASRSVVERTNAAPDPKQTINDALAAIPANDSRRQFTAADIRAPAYKEPLPIVVSYWNGIYFGGNAGYGGNAIQSYSSTVSAGIVANSEAPIGVGGPLAGGQLGYNYQFANDIVVGGEVDMDWTDIINFKGYGSKRNNQILAGFFSGSTSDYGRTGLDWLGTARVRLGYSIGNFLPYITGGLAYGQLSSSTLNAAFTGTTNANGFGFGSLTSG